MKYPNITLGRIEAVWNKLGGEEGVAAFLRDEFTLTKVAQAVAELITLTVDHSRTLAQMVTAGHYDWANDNITVERFRVSEEGDGEYQAKLFHFNRNILSEVAVKEIKAEGWGVARIEHLLAFGEKYPEEQRKFSIIALGSVCVVFGDHYLGRLGEDAGGRRYLDLYYWGEVWTDSCRFLAVRKKKFSSF